MNLESYDFVYLVVMVGSGTGGVSKVFGARA